MTIRKWTVASHCVRLNHGFWSGRATVAVDGDVIFTRFRPVDMGFVHRFEVDGVPYAIVVKSDGFGFEYECVENAPDDITERSWLPLRIRWWTILGLSVLICWLILIVTSLDGKQ